MPVAIGDESRSKRYDIIFIAFAIVAVIIAATISSGAALVVLVLLIVFAAVQLRAVVHRAERVSAAEKWLSAPHFVRVTPDVLFQQLTLQIVQLRDRRVTRTTHDTAVITTRETPVRVLIFVVLLFPIGLLFLFMKEERTTAIVATPFNGGSLVQVSGWLDNKLLERFERVIALFASANPL